MKFVTAAIWSNLLAKIAATMPSPPMNALPSSTKTSIQSGCRSSIPRISVITSAIAKPTKSPRAMPPAT